MNFCILLKVFYFNIATKIFRPAGEFAIPFIPLNLLDSIALTSILYNKLLVRQINLWDVGIKLCGRL